MLIFYDARKYEKEEGGDVNLLGEGEDIGFLSKQTIQKLIKSKLVVIL